MANPNFKSTDLLYKAGKKIGITEMLVNLSMLLTHFSSVGGKDIMKVIIKINRLVSFP